MWLASKIGKESRDLISNPVAIPGLIFIFLEKFMLEELCNSTTYIHPSLNTTTPPNAEAIKLTYPDLLQINKLATILTTLDNDKEMSCNEPPNARSCRGTITCPTHPKHSNVGKQLIRQESDHILTIYHRLHSSYPPNCTLNKMMMMRAN